MIYHNDENDMIIGQDGGVVEQVPPKPEDRDESAPAEPRGEAAQPAPEGGGGGDMPAQGEPKRDESQQPMPTKLEESSISDAEEQLLLVDRLTKAVISSVETSEMFRRFASALTDFVKVDWAAVAILDTAGDSIHLSRLSPTISSTWDLGATIVLSGTQMEKVSLAKCAVVEPDLSRESQFWTSVFFLKQGLRSVVHMPLFARREVFGSLIVGSKRAFAFKERELKLLKYTACQIAVPIEAARMELKKKRISEEEGTIEKLIGILRGGKDIASVFPACAEELKCLVPLDRANISVARDRVVNVIARYPAVEEGGEEAAETATYLLKGSPLEWLKQNRATHIEPDLSLERQFHMDSVNLKAGMRSMVRVPLVAQGEVFAALEIASGQPNAYDDRSKALLERLAMFLSASIENACLHDLEGEMLNFINAASHELKTPLTSVVASSGLLAEELDKIPDCVERKLINSVIEGAKSLERRLKRLLELAELRTKSVTIETAPIEIRELLRGMATQTLPQTQEKGLALMVEVPSGDLRAEGDCRRIEQVLSTIISNAIKTTPKGGTITLKAMEQKDNVVVVVQDTGSGYAPEEQQRLFEVYHLAEADRQFMPDLRLALANAKQMIRLQGGDMWVESEPGKGSTFAFSVPMAVR